MANNGKGFTSHPKKDGHAPGKAPGEPRVGQPQHPKASPHERCGFHSHPKKG